MTILLESWNLDIVCNLNIGIWDFGVYGGVIEMRQFSWIIINFASCLSAPLVGLLFAKILLKISSLSSQLEYWNDGFKENETQRIYSALIFIFCGVFYIAKTEKNDW